MKCLPLFNSMEKEIRDFTKQLHFKHSHPTNSDYLTKGCFDKPYCKEEKEDY